MERGRAAFEPAWQITAGYFLSGLSAVLWLTFATDAAVEDASLVFAERLFDQIDNPAVRKNIEGNSST